MPDASFYLILLTGDDASWLRCDPDGTNPCEDPGPGVKQPVVAALPDRLFCLVPSAPLDKGGLRNAKAAMRLRIRHTYPPLFTGQEEGVFSPTPGRVLGFITHPDLPEFTARHATVLERAQFVTTPLALAFAAITRDPFIWRGPDGTRAFCRGDTLHNHLRSEDDLTARIKSADMDTAPEECDLHQAAATLARTPEALRKLRLPLQGLGKETDLPPALWAKTAIAISIIGLLLCAGEFLRYRGMQGKADAMSRMLNEQYTQALDGPLGKDPFGRLLYRLEEVKGGRTVGVDVLGLLALVSTSAPAGFSVESLTLTGDFGSMRAKAGSFQDLESLLGKLSGSERYRFSLEQATNSESGVDATLKITFR